MLSPTPLARGLTILAGGYPLSPACVIVVVAREMEDKVNHSHADHPSTSACQLTSCLFLAVSLLRFSNGATPFALLPWGEMHIGIAIVAACQVCAQHRSKLPLGFLIFPWPHISLDFVTSLPLSNSNTVIGFPKLKKRIKRRPSNALPPATPPPGLSSPYGLSTLIIPCPVQTPVSHLSSVPGGSNHHSSWAGMWGLYSLSSGICLAVLTPLDWGPHSTLCTLMIVTNSPPTVSAFQSNTSGYLRWVETKELAPHFVDPFPIFLCLEGSFNLCFQDITCECEPTWGTPKQSYQISPAIS